MSDGHGLIGGLAAGVTGITEDVREERKEEMEEVGCRECLVS